MIVDVPHDDLTNYTHPLDVLQFIQTQQSEQSCALVIVTDTDGGGVRAPGAMMGVTRSGHSAGYISNGCVDADVISRAQMAMKDAKTHQVRYGKDSPIFDLQLPCGGSLDLLIVPDPDPKTTALAIEYLENRRPINFIVSVEGTTAVNLGEDVKTGWSEGDFSIQCLPRLKLRIVGRGAEPLAFARLGRSADFDVLLQSPDTLIISEAKSLGLKANLFELGRPPMCDDDAWTACVLMFHDHDWEHDILKETLKYDAFYIGALGSQKTHKARCEELRQSGVLESAIGKIRSPIGLIPSMRDASMLAISTLADVAQCWKNEVL